MTGKFDYIEHQIYSCGHEMDETRNSNRRQDYKIQKYFVSCLACQKKQKRHRAETAAAQKLHREASKKNVEDEVQQEVGAPRNNELEAEKNESKTVEEKTATETKAEDKDEEQDEWCFIDFLFPGSAQPDYTWDED